MASITNRVRQCINIDGRYLTGVVLKSDFLVMFMSSDTHLSCGSRYFEYILINCDRLVILIIAEWSRSHPVYCLPVLSVTQDSTT